MALHDRRRRGISRDRRFRAVLCSRAVLRTFVLSGIFGVAWLAGVASAHADSVADSTAPANIDQLSPVHSTSPDSVSAQSEQAALATEIQLESDTSSTTEPGPEAVAQSPVVNPVSTSQVDASAEQSTPDTVSKAQPAFDTSRAIASTNTPLAASDNSPSHGLTARIVGLEQVLSGTSQAATLVDSLFDSEFSNVAAGFVPSATPLWTPPEGRSANDGTGTGHEVGDSVRNAVSSTMWSKDSAESLRNGTSTTAGDGVTAAGETVSPNGGQPNPSPLVRFGFETSWVGAASATQKSSGGVPKTGEVVGNMAAADADRDAKVSRIASRTAWQGYESECTARPFVSPD